MASAEQIREWYAELRAGGSLLFGTDEYENSVMLATVRALNGLGPDSTDEHGVRAMAEVRAALEPLYRRAREALGLPADSPAPGRR